MGAYETRVLTRLGEALPLMSEYKKAWFLGLVEGIAGEPGRVDSQPDVVHAPDRTAARPGA